MKEYISREAIKNALVDKFKARIGSSHVPTWNDAFDAVTNLPAADVVEVQHGQWQNPEDAKCYQCSVCGKYRNQEYGVDGPIFDKFCPNCGAKMDGMDGRKDE